MKTNYQLPTNDKPDRFDLPCDELTQAGTFFANLGLECPWVGEDAYVDLEANHILGSLYGLKTNATTYCPPAVAAAVVDFGQRVIEWMRSQHKAAYVSVEFAPNKCYFWGTHGGAFGHTEDRLEAYIALILGVWQAMGEE